MLYYYENLPIETNDSNTIFFLYKLSNVCVHLSCVNYYDCRSRYKNFRLTNCDFGKCCVKSHIMP